MMTEEKVEKHNQQHESKATKPIAIPYPITRTGIDWTAQTKYQYQHNQQDKHRNLLIYLDAFELSGAGVATAFTVAAPVDPGSIVAVTFAVRAVRQ